MNRRDFIAGLGGAAATWPVVARAQQTSMQVIGWLSSTSSNIVAVNPFIEGLKEEGLVEGRNFAIQYRWADGHFDRMPGFAAEFVRQRVDLIAAATTAAALVAKSATDTIPTVFVIGTDPVRIGLAASMNRPGGNRTGMSLITHTLDAKRLELIRELLPATTTIAVLLNPTNPSARTNETDIQKAASALGLQARIINAASEKDIDAAFETLGRERPHALVVGADSVLHSLAELIVKLAAKHAIPAIYEWREHAEIGGLLSYGTKLGDTYRQVGVYAGRILKGAKPSDLPVLEPAKFELVINLKTARSLGLTVPPTLLARADDVIE
jgi:putative ABC transport system substrate-binding protein